MAVANGFVGTESEWLDSLQGETGPAGADGADGTNGWSPQFAIESDGERRVLKLTGWTGGTGTTPTAHVGEYVGASGYVSSIASGIDIRGAAGAGGGSSTPWFFDPPVAADFPTAVTEGSPASTGASDDADIGLVISGRVTTENLYARVMAAPSAPFTITAHFTANQSNNGMVAGIILRDSDTGLRTVFGVDASGGPQGLIIRRATGTTFNANLMQATHRHFPNPYGIWLRVVVTSDTQIDYYVSGDGKNWLLWQGDTANGRVAGLDQVGIGITARAANTTFIESIICDHWSIT